MTNSLKIVPYAHRGGRMTLLEYTYGKPGEQTTEGYGRNNRLIDWRPNEPFSDALTFEKLERGRSAARFWFSGSDGTRYPFFGSGFEDVLRRTILIRGAFEGTFIAVKRGSNYGIELVEA